jgi:hypothetical protein
MPLFRWRQGEKLMLIRLVAAASATAVFAFLLAPASARSCNDGNAACPEVVEQANPVKLDQFMNTAKPAATTKRAGKKSKTVRRQGSRQAAAESKGKPRATTAEVAKTEPLAAEAAPQALEPARRLVASADKNAEGVAVTSFNQANELDAAADQVQIVASNEINEIDLAAPPAPASAETFGQSVAAPQPAADNSWIGKLLLAAAGTIAIAGATRLLVA